MTNKEVIFKIINSFINEIWKMKFIMISFFGVVLVGLSIWLQRVIKKENESKVV